MYTIIAQGKKIPFDPFKTRNSDANFNNIYAQGISLKVVEETASLNCINTR